MIETTTAFTPERIHENFAGWITSLAALTEYPLSREVGLIWYNAGLPHPMYSYGCRVANEPVPNYTNCIRSFIDAETPFYFNNGLWHAGKDSGKALISAGAMSFGHLDGMVFDLSSSMPAIETPVLNLSVRVVGSPEEYIDFAETTALASDQNEQIGRQFFSHYDNLKNSPLMLLVAYSAHKPVGCSMIYLPAGDTAGNYWDWVLPEHRKKGIDSAMVGKRLEIAKAAGYKYLIAQCMDSSTRLYSKLKFEKVCELDFYGRQGY